jgi:hypothetical protein
VPKRKSGKAMVWWFLHVLKNRECFDVAERSDLVQICKIVGQMWPEEFVVRKSIVLLKRLAFARSSGEMMDTAGIEVVQKYDIAGHLTKLVDEIRIEVIAENPAPVIFDNRRAAALALLIIAASLALDYDAERALRAIVRRGEGANRVYVNSIMRKLMVWCGKTENSPPSL